MLARERAEPRGGILADDMGLGKTMTFLSLVLAQKILKNTPQKLGCKVSQGVYCFVPFHFCYINLEFIPISVFYGGTLVVCPASLVEQWKLEVEKCVGHGKLTVCLYRGSLRMKKASMLSRIDLVITTYNLVSSEYKTTGPLFQIKWGRVAVDEAHFIRNHNTASAISCCHLSGDKRWAISGTPVQNFVMDIYSIFKFMHHKTYENIQTFQRHFVTKNEYGRDHLIRTLGPLLLRRMKSELIEKGELEMPAKFIEEITFECNKEEMAVYFKVSSLCQTIYKKYLAQQNQKKSTNKIKLTAILVSILRMRQICDHPGLIDSVSMINNLIAISLISCVFIICLTKNYLIRIVY